MATRLYLPQTGAAPVSPSYSAAWNKTSDSDRIKAVLVRLNTTFTGRSGTQLTGGPNFILLRQYVTDPLDAQTISGTIKGQLKAIQNNGTLSATLAVLVKVVSNDGLTTLATLVSIAASQLATVPPEFPTGTATNRKFKNSSDVSDIPISSYACAVGDRIVIEIGYRENDTSTNTARNATLTFGDAGASDLAEDETSTAANNPWIQFSNSLQFYVDKTQTGKARIITKRYWVGNGGNFWDTAHWSLTSGGAGGASVPQTQWADAIFDSNSFNTTGQTVVVNSNISVRDLILGTNANAVTFNFLTASDIYGDLYIASNWTFVAQSTNVTLFGGGGDAAHSAVHVTTSGRTFNNPLVLNTSLNVIFQDNFTSNKDISITMGSFIGNGKTFTCFNFFSNNSNIRTIDIQLATIIVNGQWQVAGNNLTFSAADSVIDMRFSSDSFSAFVSGVITYGTVWFSANGAVRQRYNGTFSVKNWKSTGTGGKTVRHDGAAGQTVTITSDGAITAIGDASNHLKFDTLTAGQKITYIHNIDGSAHGNPIICDYIELTDNTASGTAEFYAGKHSVDNGGNTKWIFKDVGFGDQLGKARIVIRTSRTQTGVANLKVVTTRTQLGKASIKQTVTKTQLGKARIKQIVSRTQTGKANIKNTTSRLQLGLAAIKKTVTKTQLGKARITRVTSRTIGGVANIQLSSQSRTQTGKARIKLITSRTQTGKAAIKKTVTRTQTGVADIKKTVSRTQTGKAAIKQTVTKTQTGHSRMKQIVSQTIAGLSRIKKIVSRTQTGVARVTATTTKTQTGKGDIRKTTTRTQSGLSNIKVTTPQTTTGVGYILPRNEALIGLGELLKSSSRQVVGSPEGRVFAFFAVSNPAGVVTAISLDTAGTGYTNQDIVTLDGGNNDCTVRVLTIIGEISTFSIRIRGSGYVVGDVVTVSGGGDDCTIYIDSVNGTGGVLTAHVVAGGTGYTVNGVYSTTGGSGSSFQIRAQTGIGAIDTFELLANGSGYSVTTYSVTGGTGNDDAVFSVDTLLNGGVAFTSVQAWTSPHGTEGTFTRKDAENEPHCSPDTAVAAAVDENGDVHVVYYDESSDDVKHTTFATSSASLAQFTWSGTIDTVATEDQPVTHKHVDVAVIPHISDPIFSDIHVAFVTGVDTGGTDYDTVAYNVLEHGGTWSDYGLSYVLDGGANKDKQRYSPSITVRRGIDVVISLLNEDDAKVMAYHRTALSLFDNTWQYEGFEISTDALAAEANTITALVDGNDNVYIVYLNSSNDLLYRKLPSDTFDWFSWDTEIAIDDVNNLEWPSAVFESNHLFVYAVDTVEGDIYSYKDDLPRVIMHATQYSRIHARWARYYNFDTIAQDNLSKEYYQVDGNIAITDPDSAWVNDNDAFDGDEFTGATSAASGDDTTNYLRGDGVNVPPERFNAYYTPVQVRVRTKGLVAGLGLPIFLWTRFYDGDDDTALGDVRNNNGTSDWSGYFLLTPPTGGWTWEKIAGLYAKTWFDDPTGTGEIDYIQLEVTFYNKHVENGYIFTDGTYVYFGKQNIFASRTIAGVSNILVPGQSTLQTGKADIKKATSQTQSGVSRITIVTTKTRTGVARIKQVDTQTQDGTARIKKTVTQTTTGVARIEFSVSRPQTGKADIKKTVTQTETGVTRIKKIVSQLQTGVARILKVVTKTQLGKARIKQIVSRTQTGKSAIKKTVSRTQTGVARILKVVSRTQLGKAAILQTVTKTQLGKARIKKIVTKTQLGLANITTVISRTMDGVSSILKIVTKTTTGKARIKQVVSQTITGQSDIFKRVSQLQTGLAQIFRETFERTTEIQGVALITATTTRDQSGVANIHSSITEVGIDGKGAILQAAEQSIDGVASIDNSLHIKTITGVAKIRARPMPYPYSPKTSRPYTPKGSSPYHHR